MAQRINARLSGTAANPCCCNVVGLECRRRGGIASLCGHEEPLGYHSTPPKKYRTRTWSGTVRGEQRYGWASCAGAPTGQWSEWRLSGAATYAASNCAVSNSGRWEFWTQAGFDSASSYLPPNPSWGVPGFNPYNTPTTTSTSHVEDYDGRCAHATGGWSDTLCSGALSYSLTDEDTASDAIDRLNPTWSSWVAVTTPGSQCLASQIQSGFNVTIYDAEFRLRGFMPTGTAVTVALDVYRKSVAGGEFALYQTLSFSATGGAIDPAHPEWNWETTGSVPNAEGYETYVANARVLVQ